MPFMKKGEAERRRKVSEVTKERHERKRMGKNIFAVQAAKVLEAIGRRIFDLKLLSQSMWCTSCDDALSFQFLEKEKQMGLASTYHVRCHRCLNIYQVQSSRSVSSSQNEENSVYAVNCKLALGCVDSGVAHEQVNKLLSAMNLPTVCRPTMKRAEKRIERAVLDVAAESCQSAINEEKALTLKRKTPAHQSDDMPECNSPPCTPSKQSLLDLTSTPQETPRRRPSASSGLNQHPAGVEQECDEGAEVEIVVSYDFGWDKRGSGFVYDSHSGRGSVIGSESGKVLAYEVVSNYCAKCARGKSPEDHQCNKNYEGTSKGMEPRTAVNLIVKNEGLKKARCRVGTVTLDKDSSTMAALNNASPYPLKRNIDINHNTKSFNNALWKLKKGSHRFLTVEIINKLKVCLTYAISQNKGDADGVRAAIKNIANHCFGEHDNCGTWCKAKDSPDTYAYKSFPQSKAFSCPIWRKDLEAVLADQANQAEELASCGHSLRNESFNHMVVTRAPKSRHYAGTSAIRLRVAAAVTCKNLGATHVENIFKKAGLTPSKTRFREAMEKRRLSRGQYQRSVTVKGRRLHLKMTKALKRAGHTAREGVTYVSGMGSAMERAAAASAVTSWLPDPSIIQEEACKSVVVDIETTGLHATAEIVQVAAKCGSAQFNTYILPKGQFNSQASEKTGMTKEGNRLCYRNELLETKSSKAAATDFLAFLQACAPQVILVGHNIVRFDAPRLVKWMKDNELAKEFCSSVYGITDTMPLVKQGKVVKQDVLAKTYLIGPEWEDVINGAHNAVSDCVLLDGLLRHFGVTEQKLKEGVLPMRDFMERQVMNKKKKDNIPLLGALTGYVSKMMIGRMASHGVTIENLIREYNLHQRKGLDCYLGVQINGKPRVTNQKKILDQVERCVQEVIAKSSNNN